MSNMEGVKEEAGPNCSLYVHNLNERLKKDGKFLTFFN